MTIVGAVSPPGGDFSDPVTAQTLNIVQVLVTSPSRNSTTVLLFSCACVCFFNNKECGYVHDATISKPALWSY